MSTRGSLCIGEHPPGRRARDVLAMDVVNPSCAGLDVHKRTVVACRIAPGPDGHPLKELRSFGTHHPRAAGAVGLAGRGRREPSGHGGHRLVREAGVQRARG